MLEFIGARITPICEHYVYYIISLYFIDSGNYVIHYKTIYYRREATAMSADTENTER